jgi:hypothetical protein
MDYFPHVMMQRKLSSYYNCRFLCLSSFCCTSSSFDVVVRIYYCLVPHICLLILLYDVVLTDIISSVIIHNASRRDIDYFCVVHESGCGLFAHAKGRPTGSKITPLPCSMSMMDRINELRKDFGLNNETKMVVMLSISMNDMNRYVAIYPKVWFIDCTAGMLFKCQGENVYHAHLY